MPPHFNDEQRNQMIEHQRKALMFGTVRYDAGQLSGPESVTGYISYLDVAGMPTPFGMVGKGVIMCVVLEEIDAIQTDQNAKQIPITRIIDIHYPPQVN